MKRFTRQIVLWAAFALFPAAVQGQMVNDFTGSVGPSEYLNFVGAGSAVVSDRYLDGQRVYVGPYVGQFVQGGVASPSFSLICVDFENTATSQQVQASSLSTADTDPMWANTRLGSGSATSYRQLAYFGSLFDSWQGLGYGTDQRTVWTSLHSAIWGLATGDPIGGTSYALRDRIITNQLAAAQSFDADGWYVLSGEGTNAGQEMLMRTPASTVPEPSTYLLMATGLLFLAVFGRKRLKQVESA